MFFTERKIEARIHELANYRYREAIKLNELQFMIDVKKEIGCYPPGQGESSSVKVGERWKGRDVYAWLSAQITVPESWSGRRVLGLFDFGRTGGGNNSGFESLLFLNGEPYQGVDSNHKEVFFPRDVYGKSLLLDFRLWSGLEGGGMPVEQEYSFDRAEIVWLDEETDDFYYDAKVALDTVNVLDQHQPERSKLVGVLEKAFNKIDWSRPGSKEFYQSIYGARDCLKSGLDALEKYHGVTIHCVGHTHIDVAWLWRLRHTREKSALSFSTVLRLMDMFPEYTFLQTQPQLYDYFKNDYPEVYKQIKKRVEEGRWEVDGGMWLEADCNLPSGESLVRQIVMGTNFIREEFGKECSYLWLPDVFGYSWAMPQILKKAGINTFMTTKISWNQYNRMPHDTFKWRGIDGTEILTHFITTTEPWSEPGSWFYTYNGKITPKIVKETWEAYRDKHINQDLLLSYGYGDGGGGVNREMLEMRRRVDQMPGLPNVKTGNAGDFFEKLQDTVDNTESYVHTWDGELYLEYHRGTYTSQGYNKKMNRKLELLYRETEWMNVLSCLFGKGMASYQQKELNNGWKIILRNQFHDIIPGSSIKEVYEDSAVEYEEAEKIGIDVWRSEAKKLAAKNKTSFTVFNSSSWNRDGLVRISNVDDLVDGRWKDVQGRELKAQRLSQEWIVEAIDLPPMGYSTVFFEQEETPKQQNAPFTTKEFGIITPFYEIEWNGEGQIIKLYDLVNKREVLSPGARGNILQVFEDKPLAHDAWDIDLFYLQKSEDEITNLVSADFIETGELQAIVRFEWSYMDSIVKQDMVLYANHKRVDFKTYVDWQERQRLLKAAFPVDIRTTEATYDIQYGNVKRPTHWNTSWDYARFETVGHQWADLSEEGYGVSLLNDCKYGYDIKDNVLRLSLIKSAVHPDPQADRGEHYFTYSLLPHSGDWKEGHTVREAWDLNCPLTYVQGSGDYGEFSLFDCSAGNVMVDAVKKAEQTDKVVLRLHEFEGRRGELEIGSDMKVLSWQECDLRERSIGEKNIDGPISTKFKPYEVKTFILEVEH